MSKVVQPAQYTKLAVDNAETSPEFHSNDTHEHERDTSHIQGDIVLKYSQAEVKTEKPHTMTGSAAMLKPEAQKLSTEVLSPSTPLQSHRKFRLPRVQVTPTPEPETRLEARAETRRQPTLEPVREVSPVPDAASNKLVEEPTKEVLTETPQPPKNEEEAIKPRRSGRKPAPRLSHVSDIIGEWFTQRKSVAEPPTNTPEASERKKEIPLSVTTPSTARRSQRQASKQRSLSPPLLKRASQSQGLSTTLSYFNPLTSLEMHLNQPTTIDVIGVVASATSDPTRAKSGPRDWFTIFFISDPALQEYQDSQISEGSPRNRAAPRNVRVEIFRPWKASLPLASPGDVIMLRAFVVKSRTRRPYLLSNDASAWCVWRYTGIEDSSKIEAESGKPVWARKRAGSIREEIKGPPIEVGDGERGRARELRDWWEAERMPGSHKGKGKEREIVAEDHDEGFEHETPTRPRL